MFDSGQFDISTPDIFLNLYTLSWGQAIEESC